MKKLTTIILLFLFVFTNISCKQEQKELELKNNSKKIIEVPFVNIKIESTNFTIIPSKDTVIYYKTGTKLIIPKNAFVDKDGKIIQGNVKLTYREFSNALEVYLGGIPMQYDTIGSSQIFETAGMFEINASSNGQNVFPNQQNKLQVQLSSFGSYETFNIYQLDTNSGKWNYIGKNSPLIEKYDDRFDSLPEVPEMPRQATDFSFTVTDNTSNHPELAKYKDVLFEPVDGKRHGYNTTDIYVIEMKNGKYLVKFKTYYNKVLLHKDSVVCYLAFKKGVNYDNALKNYQNKYKNLIAKRNKMKQEIQLQWDNYMAAKKIYDIKVFNFQSENYSANEKITRTLQINNFGFINCDNPTTYPNGAELVAQFTDKKGNRLDLTGVSLIETGRNIVFPFTNVIKFNPNAENILWGITKDGKLAYIRSDEFKTIKQTSGNYNFKMNVCEQQPKTYEDICKILF